VLKRPFSDGTTAVDLDPLSLLCCQPFDPMPSARTSWRPSEATRRRCSGMVHVRVARRIRVLALALPSEGPRGPLGAGWGDRVDGVSSRGLRRMPALA
jgi:hypothetical protein